MTREQQHVEITLPTGHTLRVEPVAAHTFRVRVRPDSLFPEPSLLRYGIVRREWPPVDFETEESNESLTIKTARASLTISRADGRVTLCDGAGRALTREATPAQSERQGGFAAEFMLADGERLYGLGDVTRACLQRRGRQTDIWVTNVTSYVPIPYLMSDRGWALFVNTTWKLHLDLGVQQPDRLRLQAADGDLDYYLIAGDDYPALLDRYTDIVGKPVLLPQWGYGLTFVCNMYIDARGMLEDCCNFRREGIPCDVVGLEPGWMQNLYDYSVDKKWHGERFVIPRWASGSQTFVGAARRMGFKLSLWLCCDYDLSWEEERRVRSESHPGDKPETTQYSTSGENLLFTPRPEC
jgi:alpha-glucosidase (family GH31 glycosyl hydrolase)